VGFSLEATYFRVEMQPVYEFRGPTTGTWTATILDDGGTRRLFHLPSDLPDVELGPTLAQLLRVTVIPRLSNTFGTEAPVNTYTGLLLYLLDCQELVAQYETFGLAESDLQEACHQATLDLGRQPPDRDLDALTGMPRLDLRFCPRGQPCSAQLRDDDATDVFEDIRPGGRDATLRSGGQSLGLVRSCYAGGPLSGTELDRLPLCNLG
jgi:hypothetical protein